MKDNTIIHVACAVIWKDTSLFAAQRGDNHSLAGYWELPGRKIGPGEMPETCIVRELQEELGIRVLPIQTLQWVEHHYEDIAVRLYPVICELHSEGFELYEHKDAGWFNEQSSLRLQWLEADIPIVKKLFIDKEVS